MFTLKLYQNGPVGAGGRTVVLECAGIWADYCGHGVRHVQVFKKTVGVMDEDGPQNFYVGGDIKAFNKEAEGPQSPEAPEPLKLMGGPGGSYFEWGVLENPMGKTTEMFR